jgi:hypothetical protein
VLLADALDEGLAGRRPLDVALAEYERARNDAAKPYYERTCQVAALGPPAESLLKLRAAVRHQPEEASRLMDAVQGTIPLCEFFAPDNVARILRA